MTMDVITGTDQLPKECARWNDYTKPQIL